MAREIPGHDKVAAWDCRSRLYPLSPGVWSLFDGFLIIYNLLQLWTVKVNKLHIARTTKWRAWMTSESDSGHFFEPNEVGYVIFYREMGFGQIFEGSDENTSCPGKCF